MNIECVNNQPKQLMNVKAGSPFLLEGVLYVKASPVMWSDYYTCVCLVDPSRVELLGYRLVTPVTVTDIKYQV